jgi:hypothetical protein
MKTRQGPPEHRRPFDLERLTRKFVVIAGREAETSRDQSSHSPFAIAPINNLESALSGWSRITGKNKAAGAAVAVAMRK